MHPLIWVIIAAVAFATLDHFAEKRRIRQLLVANDKMWNELLIKHQKAIAEAFMDGRPFQIDIERK